MLEPLSLAQERDRRDRRRLAKETHAAFLPGTVAERTFLRGLADAVTDRRVTVEQARREVARMRDRQRDRIQQRRQQAA